MFSLLQVKKKKEKDIIPNENKQMEQIILYMLKTFFFSLCSVIIKALSLMPPALLSNELWTKRLQPVWRPKSSMFLFSHCSVCAYSNDVKSTRTCTCSSYSPSEWVKIKNLQQKAQKVAPLIK